MVERDEANVATTEFLTQYISNQPDRSHVSKLNCLKYTDSAYFSIAFHSMRCPRRRSFWAATVVRARRLALYYISLFCSIFLTLCLLFCIHLDVRVRSLSCSFSFIHSFFVYSCICFTSTRSLARYSTVCMSACAQKQFVCIVDNHFLFFSSLLFCFGPYHQLFLFT